MGNGWSMLGAALVVMRRNPSPVTSEAYEVYSYNYTL